MTKLRHCTTIFHHELMRIYWKDKSLWNFHLLLYELLTRNGFEQMVTNWIKITNCFRLFTASSNRNFTGVERTEKGKHWHAVVLIFHYVAEDFPHLFPGSNRVFSYFFVFSYHFMTWGILFKTESFFLHFITYHSLNYGNIPFTVIPCVFIHSSVNEDEAQKRKASTLYGSEQSDVLVLNHSLSHELRSK